jgi:hypothetical protein
MAVRIGLVMPYCLDEYRYCPDEYRRGEKGSTATKFRKQALRARSKSLFEEASI